MMRTGEYIFLKSLLSFWDGFHPCLLETGNSSAQGICFTQWEELCEECFGAFGPGVDVLFLIKPLVCLLQQGKGKQMKLDCIGSDTPYDNGVAELQKIL